MLSSSHDYAHRGDQVRRRARIRKTVLLAGLASAVAFLPRERPRDAQASSSPAFAFGSANESRHLRAQLDAARSELQVAQTQLERANAIMHYSTRYKITADLAAQVYDEALAERIEPELGFRVVNVESEFNPRATSPVGAVGLTQLMPSTARDFDRTITREGLYEPRTNLKIGFRYLRALIDEYKGDLTLALLVYNRGPVAVESMRALGLDPANGYETAVMKGYRGKGTVD
jgi:soluble lytic murein transglycosylase-like protein